MCRSRVFLEQATYTDTKSVAELPESYSEVPPVVLPSKNPLVPKVQSDMRGDGQIVARAVAEEFKWLEDVKETVSNDSQGLPQNKSISWLVHHSNRCGSEDTNTKPAISSLLPLFLSRSSKVSCDDMPFPGHHQSICGSP